VGEKYSRASGYQKCNAGSVPTVFVGKLMRANAKGMSVVETARAGMERCTAKSDVC